MFAKYNQKLFMGIINSINDFLWAYVIIALLVGCALWFTWRSRGVQFRMIGEMCRLMVGGGDKKDKHHEISSFQAFAVSLASRVGTGNLAGVASAIVVGGPGAVFWMWMMALLGSATAFVEATLAQLYKRRGEDSFIGGPAYYMQYGLGKKWMGIIFAVLITLTFGLANNALQSNTICAAVQTTLNITPLWSGIILTLLTLLIVFGGIQRIAKVSSVVVPVMAVTYLLLALVVMVLRITDIPAVIGLILRSAFNLRAGLGGMFGAAVMQGVKRGLFSNEAGEGSAPNAAATASISHPVKQGLIQSLGVFTDTLVICSCTAFIILLSGLPLDGAYEGIVFTQMALQSEIGGAAPLFITIAIFFFAYSTVFGNYYYGEANVRFITGKKWVMTFYRIVSSLTILFGAMISLDTAWSIVDLMMGLMTLCNLAAIIPLSRLAFKLLDDYRAQKKAGRDPQFKVTILPEADRKGVSCWD